MLLLLHIRLVAMISLKLCVLPGLSSLFFSIQTLNCQRQLPYSVCFTGNEKHLNSGDPGDSVSTLQMQRWKGISPGTVSGASLLIYSGHLSCNSPPTDPTVPLTFIPWIWVVQCFLLCFGKAQTMSSGPFGFQIWFRFISFYRHLF